MQPLQKYLLDFVKLHRNILVWPLDQLISSKNIRVSIAAANLKLFLKRTNLSIFFDHESNLFYIKDDGIHHFFGNLKRGFNLYQEGLKFRANKLFDSYLLSKINFSYNDIVIDCGANYADLWLSLKKFINQKNYITFEPGPIEHQSIKKNAPNGVHIMKGLSNNNENIRFYLNEKNADSSIVEPARFTHTTEIETLTLEKFFKENNIENVKLFKLEAEGFEPEILEGALNVLDKIEYIAVDGGYERGKDKIETFSIISNYLYNHGFKMISINFKWGRALFINKR